MFTITLIIAAAYREAVLCRCHCGCACAWYLESSGTLCIAAYLMSLTVVVTVVVTVAVAVAVACFIACCCSYACCYSYCTAVSGFRSSPVSKLLAAGMCTSSASGTSGVRCVGKDQGTACAGWRQGAPLKANPFLQWWWLG
jgi:hypothetical protein